MGRTYHLINFTQLLACVNVHAMIIQIEKES